MEDAMANTILKELREFRAENERRWKENNKRWEANDKRWEANDKRWEANDKRWEENERRWKENNEKWEANAKILLGMNERIISLEQGRKKDISDLVEILDTMQKTIDHQFTEMKEYFEAKFDKIYAAQRANEIENEQFKKVLYTHEKRLDFYNKRISDLEEWKEQFDMGELSVV